MRRNPKLRPMLTVIAALVIAAVLGVTLVHLPIGPRKGQERGEYVQELRLSLAAVLVLGDAAVHSAANVFSPSTDNPRVYATAEDVVALLDSYHESMEAAARLLMAHPLFFCRRDLGALGWAGARLTLRTSMNPSPPTRTSCFPARTAAVFPPRRPRRLRPYSMSLCRLRFKTSAVSIGLSTIASRYQKTHARRNGFLWPMQIQSCPRFRRKTASHARRLTSQDGF